MYSEADLSYTSFLADYKVTKYSFWNAPHNNIWNPIEESHLSKSGSFAILYILQLIT